MNVATILLVVMWVYAAVYFIFLLKDVIAHKDEINNDKLPHNIIISLVANFFDTLGIREVMQLQLLPGSSPNLIAMT